MKESDLNKRTMDVVQRECKGGVYYKHADKFTAGIPDCSYTWLIPTTWLEFKVLDVNESIHEQLDKVQLVELLRLQATCHRAWVVAFRRAGGRLRNEVGVTHIYAPSALWHDRVPVAKGFSPRQRVVQDLAVHGVATFEGAAYEAVAELIKQTHETY